MGRIFSPHVCSLSWSEGRACTVLQGIEHEWAEFSLPNQEELIPLTADRIRQLDRERVSGTFNNRRPATDISWETYFPRNSCHRLEISLLCIPYPYTSPLPVIPISCSSRVSSIYVRLFDFYLRADCRRAAIGSFL